MLAGAAEDAGVVIEKAGKLEIDTADELTEESLNEIFHPPTEDTQKTFARPSRPGRGPARLNRTRNK